MEKKINKLVKEWEKFYKRVFNMDVDLKNLRIPEKREGFNWLLIMIQGFTAQGLFNKCKELFKAWKWTDKNLDEVLVHSDRTAKGGHYAVWFRDRVRADDELYKLSVNNLKNQNILGITLEERLLLELFFHWKTKEHLDDGCFTLCSGSRYDEGFAPDVAWDNGCFIVDWCSLDSATFNLRAREVVS